MRPNDHASWRYHEKSWHSVKLKLNEIDVLYLDIPVMVLFEMESLHRSFEPCVPCKISIPLQPEAVFRCGGSFQIQQPEGNMKYVFNWYQVPYDNWHNLYLLLGPNGQTWAGPAVAPGYGGYAVIPEGDSQGSGLAGMQSVPYMLELIRADDIEAAGRCFFHKVWSVSWIWKTTGGTTSCPQASITSLPKPRQGLVLHIPECVCWVSLVLCWGFRTIRSAGSLEFHAECDTLLHVASNWAPPGLLDVSISPIYSKVGCPTKSFAAVSPAWLLRSGFEQLFTPSHSPFHPWCV